MSHSHRGFEYGVLHFTAPKTAVLSQVVGEHLTMTAAQVEELLWLGSIYVDEKRFLGDVNAVIKEGQYLRVHSKPRRFSLDADISAIAIEFENDDFVVVNKPSGLPVHATVDNIRENVIAVVETMISSRLFITHRLDTATSGLVVFAKTLRFQSEFNELLKQSKVEKKYRALVSGDVSGLSLPHRLVHYMEPSPRAPKVVAIASQPNWQKCSLQILSATSVAGKVSELEIQLETGRTHQIRSQLGFEKLPIVGDRAYGSPYVLRENEIALQSCYLKFGEYEFSLANRDWASRILNRPGSLYPFS